MQSFASLRLLLSHGASAIRDPDIDLFFCRKFKIKILIKSFECLEKFNLLSVVRLVPLNKPSSDRAKWEFELNANFFPIVAPSSLTHSYFLSSWEGKGRTQAGPNVGQVMSYKRQFVSLGFKWADEADKECEEEEDIHAVHIQSREKRLVRGCKMFLPALA